MTRQIERKDLDLAGEKRDKNRTEASSGVGGSGGKNDGNRKERGFKPIAKGIISGIATFAGITGVTLLTVFQPGYVPSVVGMDSASAKATLSDAGFLAETTGDGDEVVSQDPGANTQQFKWVRVSLHLEKGLERYSWEQLADVSDQIASADSEKEAIAIASKYGLCNKDGTLDGTQVKNVTLKDGREVQARVLGFRHDDRSDGRGKAGITWGFSESLATHRYNSTNSNAGGWANSSLRGYMNDELVSELPDDLASQIKRVDKLTNNVGVATERSRVEDTVTASGDMLWVPSITELVGGVSWWHDDNGDRPFYDDIYNAEGEQYQLFSDEGVNYRETTAPILRVSGPGGGSWWTRSPNPFEDKDYWGIAVYIDSTGNNHHNGKCAESYGVVPCFCI